MDAIQHINDNLDVERILNHYDFSRMRPEGIMIRSCCKIHGGSNPTSFVISSETGLWYCHTGCGKGGDIFTLVMLMEEIEFPQAVKWVADFLGLDIQGLAIAERKESHIKELKELLKVFKSRKKKETAEYILPDVKQVTKFRTFKEETLQYFELGWVDSVTLDKREGGTYELRNRLVFPIWQDGVLIGASYRRVNPNDIPKWSHQPLSIQTKDILYNYDMCIGATEVVVVEGIPDVWAYHEIGISAVCTFGAHLTEEQYKLLMRLGSEITLSYDGDDAGRKATEKAIKMLRNKVDLRRVEFSDGDDPEGIDRDGLAERYKARKRC